MNTTLRHPPLRGRVSARGQILVAFAISLLLVQSTWATLLFSEAFNYSTGALQGKINPGNSAAWTGGNSGLTIVSTNLTYPNLADQGGNSLQVSNSSSGSSIIQYANQTSGKVYYSFLFQPTVVDSGNQYFTALNPGTTAPGGSGDAIDAYYYSTGKIYVRGGGASASAGTGTALTLGTTYLIVLEVDLNTKVDSLWINPDSSTFGGTEPSPTATITGTSQTAVDNVGFKAQSGSGTYFVDNLLVGTTWADVTPSTGCVGANITSDPSNASVEAGAPASFAITADGSSPTFQWQVSTDSGANWNNDYAGTGYDTATYSFAATDASQNNYQYRCIEYVACDNSYKTSSPAILNVTCNTAGISTQPVDATISAGVTANFSVTATGSSPTYQWEYSTDGGANFYPDFGSYGTNYDTASYTTYNTTAAENNYKFRCIVHVACDNSYQTSSIVTLTVNCSTAAISSSPIDRAVPDGSTATFMVGTSGSNPTYQWQRSTDSGASWSDDFSTGYNTDTYTTPNVDPSYQGYQYRCVVYVPCDSTYATSAVATLTVAVPSSTAYRSVTDGAWGNNNTWELSVNNGATWVPAGSPPTDLNCTNILISSSTTVSNLSSRTADQIIVAAGGTLVLSSALSVAPASTVDLDVLGTVLIVGGSSSLTVQSGANVAVESGGILAHDGTSGAGVNNSGSITVASGGTFQLRRAGGTIPTVTWNPGSTCEIAYSTASNTKPNATGLAQTFENFTWNNPLQSASTDLGGSLVNVNGNFLISNANGQEVKWSGDANFGGNITINDGSLNVSGSSTPRTWTLKGNLTIGAGGMFNVSATSSAQSVLILNGTGTQYYTCAGVNNATKLNWTVNSGSTLSLNNDLSMTVAGRTLTANGTVNLNGYSLLTDLVAGSGTVQNQGGGTGQLVVGVANGTNTLDGTLTLADGASGTLGIVKGGNSGTAGWLTITAPYSYGGGLTVSNGFCYVNNTSGSGTGSGNVTLLNGTLGGTGSIAGSVVINGGTLAPGNSLGDLTINGGLTLGGNLQAEVDTTQSPNTDRVLGTASVNYGGTLTIANNGPALTTADTFQIFPAGTRSGTFALSPTNPNNDPGLAWDTSTLTTDGTLRIMIGVVASPALSVSQSGNTLTFQWAAAGFKLQSQTNNLSTGLQTNSASWFDYPDLSNPVNVTIDPANPAVFFRLSQ